MQYVYVLTRVLKVSNRTEIWAMCLTSLPRIAQDMLHDVLRASLVLSNQV